MLELILEQSGLLSKDLQARKLEGMLSLVPKPKTHSGERVHDDDDDDDDDDGLLRDKDVFEMLEDYQKSTRKNTEKKGNYNLWSDEKKLAAVNVLEKVQVHLKGDKSKADKFETRSKKGR